MSAAHESYTTMTQIHVVPVRPGSERPDNVWGKVTKRMATGTKITRETTRTRTTTVSSLNRNKQDAQIGRRKTRHKGKLKIISFIGVAQPAWTCTNIIIYLMIILTLFSSLAHLEKSPTKSFIDNGERSQVISGSKENSKASVFGVSEKSKREDCCYSDRSLERSGQLANSSIEKRRIDSKNVVGARVNSETNKEILLNRGDDIGNYIGKGSAKRYIEESEASGEMHKRRVDQLRGTWLNRLVSAKKSQKEERRGARKGSNKVKRSPIQVEQEEAISSSQIRQLVITENDGASTSTSTSTSSSSPHESYESSSETKHLSNSNNNNNSLTSSDLNSSNNTQVALSKQQQIQEQAFQRRLMELKQKYMTNRAISDKAYYILLVIYSLFIAVGTISNSLICLTVILKPKILSPRNIFIVNLAGSDLLLCVFTMPFSFIEISMKMWQMGLIPCKLVAGLQATSIFVSTISITAIALDRYKVIVYPTHQESASGTRGAALLLASVWIGALLLSLPLFRFRTVEHLDLPHKYDTIKSIDFCVEAWPFPHGRGIYSVISMMFQYVLPITIVSVVYAKISDKLQKRLIRRQRLTQLECRQKRQLNLIRRTHTMLISVSLIFGLSWLPLNLLNVIGDFSDLFRGDDQLFRVVFAVCHLIGCSSACSNPILYGYLNENFRKEFHQVYTYHMHRLARLCRRLTGRLKSDDEEEDEEDDDDDEDDYDEEYDEEEEDEEDGEDGDEDEDEELEDEEYNDESGAEYGGQFYNGDSGHVNDNHLHQPITPTSTVDSSAFASDEFERKDNKLSRQFENRDNMGSLNGKLCPTKRLNSPISSASGSHAPASLHLPLGSSTSEEAQRKCSLPLPLPFSTKTRAREARNSSASLKTDRFGNQTAINSGPKLAQSCILELAESCNNKFLNLRNRVSGKKSKFKYNNNNNNQFKTPELKLFPPSSATGTSQTTSSGNQDKETTDIESSAVRRYSFQTLSNSRQTLGRTMRFCLCISTDSLVESDGVCGNSSVHSRSLSLRSPRRGRMRKAAAANREGEVIDKSVSNLVGSEQLDGSSSLGPLVSRPNKRTNLRRNKRRHRRVVVSGTNCDCNCHKSAQMGSPALAGNINQESGGGGDGSRYRSSLGNLLQPAEVKQCASGEEELTKKGRLPSSGVIGHSNKDISINSAKERQGRRVWLRFFADKQQQERYIDCATSNTTATIEQCNGNDKLTPIESQKMNNVPASDLVVCRQEQSIKNGGKNEEEEEEEGADDDDDDDNDAGNVDEHGDGEDNNSNMLREQTKPSNAQARARKHTIAGKYKNKQGQLEELVARGRKQHCANCKQVGAGKLESKRRRIKARRRREGPTTAHSSRKSKLVRENSERKVKEGGSVLLRNETTIYSGGSKQTRIKAASNTRSSHPTGGGKKGADSKQKKAEEADIGRASGKGEGRIEGLKVEVAGGVPMNGAPKIAGYYYLSVENARSRGGSDVSKEQSTELVVINGDIDVAELEVRARDTASSPFTTSRNSPSLFKSSFEKENKHGEVEMLERNSAQSSIDIRHQSTIQQDEINNMQNSVLCSSNNKSTIDNNNKSNNMHENNPPSGNYNGRLRTQIKAGQASGSARPLGQLEKSACVVEANANVANNREGEKVAKVGRECESLASGCQMNYVQVKKGAGEEVRGEERGKEEDEDGRISGNCVECLKNKSDIWCKQHDLVARAVKSASLNEAGKSSIAVIKPDKSEIGSATETPPQMASGTFSLSLSPDMLMTDSLDARSAQLQRVEDHHHIDETEIINNNNNKINRERVFDGARVDNNGTENLSSQDLIVEKTRIASNSRTNSKQQQLVRMQNSLTHPSTDCNSTLLRSDSNTNSNSSSCACLHSPSSSCTCSISSACHREAAIMQPEEAITSGCITIGASKSCSASSICHTTSNAVNTLAVGNSANRNSATCVSISIIKNAADGSNNHLATINRERPLAPVSSAAALSATIVTQAATTVLDSSKWRSSCANSSLQVHELRGAKPNKLQTVSSSLSALPCATAATAASALQSLSTNVKTNASMNICQLLSTSTSCSGSGSGSVSSASNSNSASIVGTTASSTTAATTTTTTNNSVSGSSLASNDEFTCSSSVAGVAVAQTLDSFASSSASLEVARVMASATAFKNTNHSIARCPAQLSRMTKQLRRLSTTSFGTSTDLQLKTNERDSNISLQPLVKQCNGRSISSNLEQLNSPAMFIRTTNYAGGESPFEGASISNKSKTTIDSNDTHTGQTSSARAGAEVANAACSILGNSLVVSSSNDSDALWQRFGDNDVLTKSQEDLIMAERKRF